MLAELLGGDAYHRLARLFSGINAAPNTGRTAPDHVVWLALSTVAATSFRQMPLEAFVTTPDWSNYWGHLGKQSRLSPLCHMLLSKEAMCRRPESTLC